MAVDDELRRAHQRLAEARRRYEEKRAEKQKRDRRRDTRQKILLGAWLRDVELPVMREQGNETNIAGVADAVGAMIARQTHKTVRGRQRDIEELRPVFGDDWAQRWKQHIEAGGE